jgi:hypothetical protein
MSRKSSDRNGSTAEIHTATRSIPTRVKVEAAPSADAAARLRTPDRRHVQQRPTWLRPLRQDLPPTHPAERTRTARPRPMRDVVHAHFAT